MDPLAPNQARPADAVVAGAFDSKCSTMLRLGAKPATAAQPSVFAAARTVASAAHTPLTAIATCSSTPTTLSTDGSSHGTLSTYRRPSSASGTRSDSCLLPCYPIPRDAWRQRMETYKVVVGIAVGIVMACGPKQVELTPETENALSRCLARLTREQRATVSAALESGEIQGGMEESASVAGGGTVNLQGLEDEHRLEGYRLFLGCMRDYRSEQLREPDQATAHSNVLVRFTDETQVVQDPPRVRTGTVEEVVLTAVKDGQLSSRTLHWRIMLCSSRRTSAAQGPRLRFESPEADRCWIAVSDGRIGGKNYDFCLR